MSFHILINSSVPSTQNGKYNCDAYNQFALLLAHHLDKRGKQVYFYGTSEEKVDFKTYFSILSEQDYKDVGLGEGSELDQVNSGEYLSHSGTVINDWQNKLQAIYYERGVKKMKECFNDGDFILHTYFPCGKWKTEFPTARHVMFISMGSKVHDCQYTVFATQAWAHYILGGLKEYITPDKYDVIPPFFEPTHFKPILTKPKEPVFLYMARIQACKGIRTFFIIAEKFPQYKFICAGHWTGPTSGWINVGDGSALIPKNVEMIGYVNAEKRKELLGQVTALIQPSPYPEPFGFNIVEAYLSGTPVITPAWGSFTEIVREGITGYCCRTYKDYFSAVDKVQNIDRSRVLKFGLRFTPEKIMPKIEKFFNRITEE